MDEIMFKFGPDKSQTANGLLGEAADSSHSKSEKNKPAMKQPTSFASETDSSAHIKLEPPASNSSKKSGKKPSFNPKFNWKQSFHYLWIVLFAFVCVAAISLILVWKIGNDVYQQKAGEVAVATVLAPQDLTYNSNVLLGHAQDEAANDPANNVYQRQDQTVNTNRARLQHLLDVISSVRTQSFSSDTAKNQLFSNSEVATANLTIQQINSILTLNDLEWSDVAQQSNESYNLIMSHDIHSGQLPDEINNFQAAINNPWSFSLDFARLDVSQRTLVVALVKPFLSVNSQLDRQETAQQQQEARTNVSPIPIILKKGEEIVRQGQVITSLQLEELAQFGFLQGTYNWQSTVGTVGLVGILILVLLGYFSLLFNQVWGHPRVLTFMGLLLIVSAAAIRFMTSDPTDHTLRPFLLPLATISLLLTALFDINLSLFMTMILAILAGYAGQSVELAVITFAGGAVGALALWKAERTIIFAYAGAMIAGTQLIAAFCFALVNHTLDLPSFGLLVLTCGANALMSTSLAFFSFSILGKFFGVTTVLGLLELAHPNQPLLRRLMREAPGTYHHSMLVSNLAEQAAEQIAGEALLARVGAYYHDIGKLSRPACFIDNQGGGANIHDTLDPRESVKIIKAHVSDGVELARKHRLPRRVIDIIHQHHGTCLVSFFYQKAVKEGLDVDEIDFRYPGPKPQSKIAAIVMLADGCEAAVRANIQSGRIPTGASVPVPASPNADGQMKQTTIAEVVNKIVDDRLLDHQLDECSLTLRDLDELRRLFTQVLTDIYHPRINYPDSVRPTSNKPSSSKDETVVQREGVVVQALPEPKPEPKEVQPLSFLVGGANTQKMHPTNAADSSTETANLTTNTAVLTRLTEMENKQLEPGTKSLTKDNIGGAGRSVKKD